MSFAAATLFLWMPTPPKTWEPEIDPEYSAICYAVDAKGERVDATITVSGQMPNRLLEFKTTSKNYFPLKISAISLPVMLGPISGGTYGYGEVVTVSGNPEKKEISLEGLGPQPNLLTLRLAGMPTSPIFNAPELIGICHASVSVVGSPFVPGEEDRPL